MRIVTWIIGSFLISSMIKRTRTLPGTIVAAREGISVDFRSSVVEQLRDAQETASN